jgi:hypothetical protein
MALSKYDIYLKQLIDGMPSTTFSAGTFPPHPKDDEIFHARYDKILKVSREKYSKPRKEVEARINKSLNDIEKQEDQWEKKKEEYKQKEKDDKAKKRIAERERLEAEKEQKNNSN